MAGAVRTELVKRKARMRRVLMITYDFPPNIEMGAQACAQIARHLPLYGWEPVVLTVREHYIERIGALSEPLPAAVIRTRMLPHPFTIYRSLKARFRPRTEEPNGLRAESDRTGAIRRWVLSLLATPDAYSGWIPFALLSGLKAIRNRGIERLFSSGPCWSNHLVGLGLARLSGLPWIAHFRDPWTEVPQSKPVSAVSAWVDRALERMIVRYADSVVCVTGPHTNLLRSAFSELPFDKFVTIPNGYDGAEWDGLQRATGELRSKRTDTFVITYAGGLDLGRRNPLPVFRALRALVDAGDVVPERICVDLFGWCDLAEGRPVEEIAAECGLAKCVHVRKPLSRPETLRRMLQSDLLLLLAEGWTLQIPGKTYEYLRARRPILALTSEGALASLLRQTGGAWVVDPTDEKGIACALRETYRAWQQGGVSASADPAVVSRFDRRTLAGRFAELLDTGID